MGEESEERSGRIAGIVKSIFGRKKDELPIAPPPSPPREIKLPPNVAELNLIKEKVQGVSRPVEAASAGKGPDFEARAAPLPPQAQAIAKTAQQDSTPQTSPAPPTYVAPPASGKSSLDEIKKRIEESAQRKDPAHLKKNIEEVNEHLRCVKRKSALSEKKIEKIVDEKVREELERMGSSIKERLKRGPAQAEREQLEKFQKQLVELMDVSDKKSELELEQMRSQMDEMRQQMKDLPLIVAQKEIEELSPIREEVAVLRGELRKFIPNVSDPSERSKLEDTLARAEALSKRLEYNPQVESVRAELGEIKSAMGSVASAIENVGHSGEEIKKQESEAQESIKQGMEVLKKEILSVPETLKESEAPKLDSIRRSISELRTLVQQNAEAKQPPAERRMLNEILAHLSAIEQKQGEDERKLSRLLNLDADSMKLMDSLHRRMDGVSRRVSSEGQAEMDAFREELRTLRNSVRASISASRSQEEQELLKKLHGELGRILAASEEKSVAALGELKGELSKVSSRLSRIPSAVGAREKPELGAIRGEIFGLQKVVANGLAQPTAADGIRSELEDMRNQLIAAVSAEQPELDSVKSAVSSLKHMVENALAKPGSEELDRRLNSLRVQIAEMLQVSEARTEADLGQLRQKIEGVQKELEDIPAELSAEKPEIESLKFAVSSLQDSLSSSSKSSLLAIKDKLDGITAPKPQQVDSLSEIKESVASLRDLLEKRIEPAEPQEELVWEERVAPVRRPKRKAARIQKKTGKRKAAVSHKQKAGKRKKPRSEKHPG